eukprot:c1513_g1_i1 orf=124-1698(-)
MSSSRDIPGFYYDAERNRYFPTSSRGGQHQRKSELIQQNTRSFKDECTSSPNIESKVLQILSKREVGLNSRLGSSCTGNTFKQKYLETQASKPWIWSYGASTQADCAVEEFYAHIQTNEGLKGARVVTWGNNNGLDGVYEVMQSTTAKNVNVLVKPERIFPQSVAPLSTHPAGPPGLIPSSMVRVSSSKVTAIRKLRNTKDEDNGSLIFTTLGSGLEGGAIYLLKQRQVYDGSWNNGQPLPLETVRCAVTDSSVWTAAYCACDKATLGTSKGAALVHLETSSLRWLVHSRSDVLSQQCDLTGNLIFCGFRNGFIAMVDIRSSLTTPRRMPLIHTRPVSSSSSSFLRDKNALLKEAAENHVHWRQKRVPFRDKAAKVAQNFCETMRMQSAVCSLVLLHSDETYLLASAMNGDINLWDRRLVEKGPVLTYEGNQNSHSLLHLGVDASESLLASGGEDCGMRIWSLRSGKLLQTISGLPGIVHTFSSTSESTHSFVDSSINDSHTWRMWLGSSAGLMYMHGSATDSV